MGRYPTGPKSCLEDPHCHVLVTSLFDPGPICVFCFWALVVVVCGTFQLCKLWTRRASPVKLVDAQKSSRSTVPKSQKMKAADETRLNVVAGQELVVTGYTWSGFGEFCYYLCCLTSLHWIALYILILLDTYYGCELSGIDNLCFFGNNFIFGTYKLSGQVFFIVWWLSAIWWTTWVVFKGKVHNWFRVPVPLAEATAVHVWTSDQEEVLSSNVLAVVHAMRRVKQWLFAKHVQGHSEVVPILVTANRQRFFLFEGRRVLVNGNTLSHARVTVGSTFTELHQNANGLTVAEAEKRLDYAGLNEIPYKPDPLLQTIVDELFTFFHVYQLASYMLQFWNSYLFVAALMTFIVLLSSSVTIYTRRRSQFTIAKIAHMKTEAEVFRSGSWMTIDASFIAPGDVVRVRSTWVLPCDLFIVEGSCIVDESALTGEAMPVQKYSAPGSAAVYHSDGPGARHTLFSGTTVLQAGSSENNVRAIVTATGMNTSKGQLLSSILYPQKMVFKYDEELPIVAFLLVLYGIVCFCISVVFQNHSGAQSFWVTKWIYCMAIINQIMSPLLPVALQVGQLHSVDRLKRFGIHCLNPKRIAIAGKIRVFCFDKTGTLTKEGLDFVGIQPAARFANETPVLSSVLSQEKGDVIDNAILQGMASCHALSRFNGELVGNQVEVKMFRSVGWDLAEHSDGTVSVRSKEGKELRILRRNEFDHSKATMSVVVREADAIHVYCKGSFERIQEICTPSSIPADYSSVAQAHALDGCYVLALAHRQLSATGALDVLPLSRNDVEKDLNFLALLLFRNELKPESRAAIEALKEGEVRPIMVTGDNAQCAFYIAKESGMVAPHVQVLLADISNNNSIAWRSLTNDAASVARTLSTEEMLAEHIKGLEGGRVELAVTGKSFNLLRTCEAMDRFLLHTRICARFTPTDKVEVATMLRDRGLVVGMCGDGGNDCGALRAAHAGIALSEAEASVVSPFTSRDKSVTSVVDLLREGRAALHTSFACYKFLIIYGLMFSILKLCAYWYGIIPCELDYIFIDGVAVLLLGYAMTLCNPEKKLAKERPTSSLLGPITVASVLGVWVSDLLFLVSAVYLMSKAPGYIKWPAMYSHEASWWTLSDNWESTVIFFTMYFQFITSAFVFSFGSRFRKSVFANPLLVGSYVGLVVLFSLLLLLPSSFVTRLWHVASEQFNRKNTDSPVWILYQQHGGRTSPGMPFSLRLRLWLLIVSSMIVNCVWQKVFVEGYIGRAVAKRYPSSRPVFHP